MIHEIWKDVVGYEGLYSCSNSGYIKSVKTWRFLKNQTDRRGKGYLFVRLTKNKQAKMLSVHRAVASAFLVNDHNYPQVNHKDGNPKNNCVENLEWCTGKMNTIHYHRYLKGRLIKDKSIK